MKTNIAVRPVVVAALVLSLAGCVSVPPDRGMDKVRSLLARQDPALAARVPAPDAAGVPPAVASEPVTAKRAVILALAYSPAARALYAELGLAQADWLEASTLSNPQVSLLAQDSSESDTRTMYGYGLVQEFTDLLFLRARRQVANQVLVVAQTDAAAMLQELAADVAASWVEAAGAAQQEQMFAIIAKAAVTSAALAQRFHDAGNINDLELAREQAAAQRALLELDDAKAAAAAARLALNRIIGLRPPVRWTLAGELPLPSGVVGMVDESIELALAGRLDLAARRQEAAALTGVADLARSLRWLPLLEVGVDGERDTDGSRLFGPSLTFELPIFGRNRADVLRADAALELVRAGVEAKELAISNAVASAFEGLAIARARVDRYRLILVPLQEAIVAESQLHQNFMIIGQFELLASKREEYETYSAYLGALRDYWLARVHLDRVTGGALLANVDLGGNGPGVGAVQLPTTPPGGGHSGHGGMGGMEGMDHSKMDHSRMNHSTQPQAAPAEKPAEKPAKEHDHGNH